MPHARIYVDSIVALKVEPCIAYTPSARFFAFLAPTGSVLRGSWFPYHVRASVVLPRPVALDGSLFIASTRLNLSSQHAVSTARLDTRMKAIFN